MTSYNRALSLLASCRLSLAAAWRSAALAKRSLR